MRSLCSPFASPVAGRREKVLAASVAALGTSDIDFWFRDFVSSDHGLSAANAGTGTATLAVTGETSGLGWLKISTGATASSQGGMTDAANSVQTQSKPWYVAARFRLLTVPASGTQHNFVMRDAGSGARYGVGVDKSLAANNFCIMVGATGIDTGIPFDLVYHVGEAWGPGGGAASPVYWRFDGGGINTGALGFTQVGAGNKFITCNNVGTAADQSSVVDWFAVSSAYLP